MRTSENTISKWGKYSFYVFIVYMMGMTGLYFHMDTRFKVLSGNQKHTLELFRTYVNTNTQQQDEINSLNKKLGQLADQVDNVNNTLDEKLTDLYHLLLSREANASEMPKEEEAVKITSGL